MGPNCYPPVRPPNSRLAPPQKRRGAFFCQPLQAHTALIAFSVHRGAWCCQPHLTGDLKEIYIKRRQQALQDRRQADQRHEYLQQIRNSSILNEPVYQVKQNRADHDNDGTGSPQVPSVAAPSLDGEAGGRSPGFISPILLRRSAHYKREVFSSSKRMVMAHRSSWASGPFPPTATSVRRVCRRPFWRPHHSSAMRVASARVAPMNTLSMAISPSGSQPSRPS